MKLQNYLAILPLAFAATHTLAEEAQSNNESVFHFSTQVSRTVEKDLIQAEIYSRKSGKNLSDLKKAVSTNLNKVLAQAKQYPKVDISAEGISNYADYDNKGKVNGWVAEGRISLKSKDFDAVAKILENLDDQIAISHVDFSVSPEKMVSLEDEMTLEIIKQFQHKAEVIQTGLNAKKYILSDIRLNTPNGDINQNAPMPRMYALSAKMASADSQPESLPMEAGKATISATASGKVTFSKE
ncbi:hypothetical protein A6B43_03070 [Vespertiliibacter pulmonis]|uniref:Putative secreted protein n=1 Tax=Vespertiliibacter pulmonis TaxID=1443036 RepID=A0A3N4VI35_9PAST|nr:SIMPL domain-containing protein [Vespertiliibacter pulmonis]QLB20580.1 hypothetical protein A6B43_03070 [Vespertiliibacter pulmonis]RPE82712.1 putative secreted protein [Vespertiliibacter pulmonis]